LPVPQEKTSRHPADDVHPVYKTVRGGAHAASSALAISSKLIKRSSTETSPLFYSFTARADEMAGSNEEKAAAAVQNKKVVLITLQQTTTTPTA